MKKNKIILLSITIFIFFISTPLFSQHLPLNQREEIALNSIFSDKNIKILSEAIHFILTQDDITDFIINKTVDKYLHGEWDQFFKNEFSKLLNSYKIKLKLKKIVLILLKNSKFQKALLKIVKNEREPQKVIALLNSFFSEKIKNSPKSKKIVENIIVKTFYCPENSRVFSKKMVDEILKIVKERKEIPLVLEQKIKEAWVRKLVSLPYEHLILDWSSKYVEKIPTRLKTNLKKKERQIFKKDYLYNLFYQTVKNSFKNGEISKKLELYLYSMLTNKETIISNLLYDIVVSDSWIDSLSLTKELNECFILKEEDFIFNIDDLNVFLKSFFENEKEINQLFNFLVDGF